MWKWSDLKRIFMRKASMRDTADLGAIMWPVAYPPEIDPMYVPENAHVTVVIFDNINDENLGFTLEDVIAAVQESIHDALLWCKVDGLEWFGAEQDVPVLRVHHDYLYVYRQSIMGILAAKGIPVDMTFPEYKPHVTIPDVAALDGVWPDKVMAGPVE